MLSLTRQRVPGGFGEGYLGGDNITGDFIQDTFGIADITLANVTMGLGMNYSSAPAAEGELRSLFGGILGIGLPFYNYFYLSDTAEWLVDPSFLEVMYEQGVIESRAFSLYLDSANSSTGSITIDGVNTAKNYGDIVTVTILPEPQFNNTYQNWTAELSSISLINEDGSIAFSSTNLSTLALIDSGTSLSYIPASIAAPR